MAKQEKLKELKDLWLENNRRKYPNLPEYARACPKFSDSTANGLTKCIIEFLKLSGHYAERISVTGRYVDNTKIVTDVLGHKKKIGSGKWIKSSMQVGSADISATIKGLSVKIEVKMKDSQSPEQIEYQKDIENAGGIYFIAHNFNEFKQHYDEILHAKYKITIEFYDPKVEMLKNMLGMKDNFGFLYNGKVSDCYFYELAVKRLHEKNKQFTHVKIY